MITSLFKHVAYGASFGCVIAGYGIAALASVVPALKVRAALRASTAAVLISGVSGVFLASFHFSAWPTATPLIAALRHRLPSVTGHILIDDSSVEAYYLGSLLRWHEVSSSYYFAYADPKTGKYLNYPPAAYTPPSRIAISA